ncbi:hypothetical protein [Geodermatophilus sp. CPCC 205506]|uniref:hypothetical protein n=1 Tax=Geodermatophilus sp. CPCC 205506 TaxID=2936596 RepID=UPI003EEF4354
MTDLRTERAIELDPAGPSDPHEQQPGDPPPAASGGVALTRLIGLARLTPPQALEIGAGVLAEAARRAEPDGGSPDSDRFEIGPVVVGADGRVVLGPGGPGGAAVEAVLADLAGAARLRGRRPDPAADQLLDALDRAGTLLPVSGVPAVARMLGEAAGAVDRSAVRAELAALVAAIGGAAGPAAGPIGNPSPAVRAAPAGLDPQGATRTTRRRIGAWLLSALVLAAVVSVEVAVLRDDIAVDIRLLLDAGRSGSTPSAAPEPDGPPIVPPAPAAAGTVTAVDLRLLAQCAPGAPCDLRLLVRLVPGPEPQVVTWSYRIVDRCTGATETAPGGTVTVPPEGERAVAAGTVPLPALQAVAVVAVTDLPAAAASPPVFAGSCRSDGQSG